MSERFAITLAVALLVLAPTWAIARRSAKRPMPARRDTASPLIVVRPAAPSAPMDPIDDEAEAAALSLMLSTLSARDLARVQSTIDDATTDLDIATNPLVEDVLDQRTDPDQAMKWLLPSLIAAEALGLGRWTSAEGERAITISATCPADARCTPLWRTHPARWSPDEQRTRFLAWPVGCAALLRATDAHQLATRLRERIGEPSTTVALVVEARDLRDEGDGKDVVVATEAAGHTAITALRESASVLSARLQRFGNPSQALALVARSSPHRRPLPWLHLRADEVLVVPRLAALIDLRAFVREIEDNLPREGARFAHRPQPLN